MNGSTFKMFQIVEVKIGDFIKVFWKYITLYGWAILWQNSIISGLSSFSLTLFSDSWGQ